jgi:hypothetical protein
VLAKNKNQDIMVKRQTAKRRSTKKTKNRLFLPYPLVFFLLLCAGVYLCLATFRTHAQDIDVTGRIPGPTVTNPATISPPTDGTHFKAIPIDVNGTCPTNAAYVEIFRNNFMGGSAICQADHSYSLKVDLFAGQNQLVAHVFNITDDEGPVSNPTTVFYDAPPPSSPSTPSSDNQGPSTNTPNNATKTPFVYKGYYTGQTIEWPIEISGGTAPYAFNIDWGDGDTSVISRKNADDFNINHKYTKPGGYKGSYNIQVQASDVDGNYSYLQFFVIVSDKASATALVANNNDIFNKPPPALDNLKMWLRVAWPVYGALVVMVLCFKLGEMEELSILKHKPIKHRRA